MVDIEKALKTTIKKGKVMIGAKQTQLAMSDGTAKFVVMANNCPKSSEIKKLAAKKKIPLHLYHSTSIELGYSCGKAFAVSAFAVLDDGGSNIASAMKKR